MSINSDVVQGFYRNYFSYLPDFIGLANWEYKLPSTRIATSGSTFTLALGVDNVFRLGK